MKKQTAKLVLKKETIENLENDQMNAMKGGLMTKEICSFILYCSTDLRQCHPFA